MKETLNKILQWPPIAHAMAANTRFGARLGPQFAGAITYFSVLSLVPILMFSFAMIGMTLTVIRPDLLDQVQAAIHEMVSGGGADIGEKVTGVIENALNNWRGVGIFALLTAAYAGSGWVGNLKKAIRVMWREVPVDEERKVNPILDILSNVLIFLGLLVCLVASIVVAQGGSSASEFVVAWLGLQDVPGIGWMMRLATVVLTFVASWLLVGFLFLVLPDERAPWRTWLIGVSIGALLLTVLQQLAGTLIGVFKGNAAAAVFGPLIVAMLLMNLLATVLLMMAAWIGIDASRGRDTEAVHGRAAEMAASRSAVALAFAEDAEEGPAMVRQDVAERGVRAGLGVGYGVGAATGVGIGAIIAAIVALFSKLLNR